MRTVKQIRKITLACILLTFVLLTPVSASTADEALWSARIQRADLPTLQALALLADLDTDQSEETLRTALLASRNLVSDDEPTVAVLLSISHAEEIIQQTKDLFILRGKVSLIIEDQILIAEQITVDRTLELLVAEGGVFYRDKEQELSGAYLLLHYEDGALKIADSYMEEVNPDDAEVTLILRSALGQSNASGSYQHYHSGVLSLALEDPLSSIRAKEVLVRQGGDLFFKGATLYIGRVPMFYLPFVPVLRNQMVGNPAMGFSSDRGMFASATWELFGRRPSLSVSESALFAAKEESERFPRTIIYDGASPKGRIGQWAKESDSYLSLFGDVSERIGVSLGVDSQLRFFDKRLQAEVVAAVGHDGTDDGLGYLVEPSLSFRNKALQLTLELPIYSDPEVRKRYLNRITAFSLLEALGKEVEFPTDISSTTTSYDWSLRGSFSAPTAKTTPYLSSFTISSFRTTIPFRYNRTEKVYEMQNPTLATFRARARGTLFSLKRTITKEEKPVPAKKEEFVPLTLAHDPLLPAYYQREQSTRTVSTQSKRIQQELSLTYNLEERFTERRKADVFADLAYRSSYTQGSVRLQAIPHSRLFTISEEIIAQLNIVEDPTKQRFYTQEWQLTSHTRATLPIVGVTYSLKQRIYHERTVTDSLGSETVISSFAFDKQQVSEHQLTVAYPIELPLGRIQLGFKSTLWPLAVTMSPSLSYTIGPLSISTGATIVEADDTFELTQIVGTIGYKSDRFTASFSPAYTFAPTAKEGFTFKEEVRYRFKKPELTLSQHLHYIGQTAAGSAAKIEELRFGLETKELLFTYKASGVVDALQSESLQGRLRIAESGWQFYKNRMKLSFALDTSLYYHFQDPYASALEAKLTLGFWVAEFLDLSFSIASQNTGLFRYYNAGGDFSFALLWEDLLRSFDFSGSGRTQTQFTLSQISFALTHDLGDWSLNCKYSGNIVLSSNQYQWVPTLSVYLSWKVLDELKREEHWTVQDDQWIRSL